MVTENIDALAENLEKQELEVERIKGYFCLLIFSFQATNGVVTPHLYEQLLAIYLYRNDLYVI